MLEFIVCALLMKAKLHVIIALNQFFDTVKYMINLMFNKQPISIFWIRRLPFWYYICLEIPIQIPRTLYLSAIKDTNRYNQAACVHWFIHMDEIFIIEVIHLSDPQYILKIYQIVLEVKKVDQSSTCPCK